MNSIENYIEKAKLWAKSILDKESDVQITDSSDLKDIDSLKSGEYEIWRREKLNLFEEEKVWTRIEKKISVSKPKAKRIINYWQSVAAVLIVALIGSAGYILFQEFTKAEQEQLIMPGKSMAYLEIDKNKRIELTAKDTLMLFDASKVKLDSGKIVYAATDALVEKNEYHKINVPRNGEFYVQLSDGTKVWVNSESTIGFKSKFDGKTRVVDLVGEAYFEVAKDPSKPFIVRTDNMDVRVLGTQFNVKAYADEDFTYTTLNEGKVRVRSGEIKEDLLPDQQLVFNKHSNTYETREVDASVYSAWVKGKFIFKDEKLEDILIALSRWYDVKVFYQNARLKDDKFSIRVDRYDDINILLDHLRLTGGVDFEIKNNALVVK